MQPNITPPSFRCPKQRLTLWQRLMHWRGAFFTGVFIVALIDALALTLPSGTWVQTAIFTDGMTAVLMTFFVTAAVSNVGYALALCCRLYGTQIQISDGALVAIEKKSERRIPLDKIFSVESRRGYMVVLGASTSIAIPKICLTDEIRQFFKGLANEANAIEVTPQEVRDRLSKGVGVSFQQLDKRFSRGNMTQVGAALLYTYGFAFALNNIAHRTVSLVVLFNLIFLGLFIVLCWLCVVVPIWNFVDTVALSGVLDDTSGDTLYFLEQVRNPEALKGAFVDLVRCLPIPIKGEVDITSTSRMAVGLLKKVLPVISCEEFGQLDKIEKRMLYSYPDAEFFVQVVDVFVRCGSYEDIKSLLQCIESAGAYGNPNHVLGHWPNKQVSLESLRTRVGARFDALGTQQTKLLHPAGVETGSDESLLHPAEGSGSGCGSGELLRAGEEAGEPQGAEKIGSED